MVSTKSEKKGHETRKSMSREPKSRVESELGAKAKTPLKDVEEENVVIINDNDKNSETIDVETVHIDGDEIVQPNGKSEQNGKVSQNGNQNSQEPDNFILQVEIDDCSNENHASTVSPPDTEPITITLSDDSASNNGLSQNTESGSVEIVESTTSEIVECNNDEKSQEGNENSDVTSYESNMLLKDVKVTLNDCLKESKAEPSAEYTHKDASFGRTLRTMSGRRSLSRMRNITVRDRQPSPNSSLFVNTSDVSISQDTLSDTPSYRSLRSRTGAIDVNLLNGSPSTRKRKYCDSDIENINKKSKIEVESSGIFNSSIEFFKSFRRSNQESTPCKVQDKPHTTIENDNANPEPVTEESAIAKKWCIIM